MLFSVSVFAQTNNQQETIDDLTDRVNQLEKEIEGLKQGYSSLQSTQKHDKSELMQNWNGQQKEIIALRQTSSEKYDSLSTNLKTKANQTEVDAKVQQQEQDFSTKILWVAVAIAVVLIVSLLVAFVLHKKLQRSSDDKILALKQKADELNEKVVNTFSSEMAELQKLSKSAELLQSANNAKEPDHSLVKTLADRITFMEMTLSKMDPKTRGFKQLSKSIVQMKENLLEKGYELVELLGKEYKEGMKCSVTIVDDEEMEQGKQIITSVTKPQINYQGVMIQMAEIIVSQNS